MLISMEGPSLSELTNIKSEATTNPGVILDSRDAVHQLNQSAQFNAEMKQRKYEKGLENLKGIYQDLGAIQETPVMQQDRPVLNKMMADVLNTIAEDPHAALGGPKFNEIQRQLGQLRTLSTTSKQDNVYRDFHDKSLEADPSLSTPENKGKIAQFNASPVGQREKFLLDTPVKFDPEAAMGNILKQKQVAVPYAGSSFEGPNNEWIVKETGTKYKRDSALGLWNQGYETGTDANNQPIKKWASEQFERIKKDPEQLQKFGNPKDAKEFYENLGGMMYGAKEDIIGEKASTRTANPYSLANQKEEARFKAMNIKFEYDKILTGMRANNSFALAKFREKLHNETKYGKIGALKGMVDAMVKDAHNGPSVATPEGTFYKMNVSSDVLKSYGTKEGVLKKEVKPDDMLVSDDGTKIKQIYYKQAGKPASGVDEAKSRTFSKDEFTARFGKDVLGVSATEKEINADDDNDSGESPTPKPSSKKSIPGF